jgi:hypothetical protein
MQRKILTPYELGKYLILTPYELGKYFFFAQKRRDFELPIPHTPDRNS